MVGLIMFGLRNKENDNVFIKKNILYCSKFNIKLLKIKMVFF